MQIPVVPRCVDVISVKRYRAASRVAVTNVRMLSYGRHDDDGRISSTYSSYSRATFYELTHSAVTKIRLQHTQHHGHHTRYRLLGRTSKCSAGSVCKSKQDAESNEGGVVRTDV